ncbi:MAG: ATP-binding protein [Alphaproteobacteria bacterium]|nr:ATP-binding protein [Alphaproteobacteria bacterium]
MKRIAFNRLKEWKNKPNRKPLILQGARQVGKTWLMREFGKQEYENTAYINFDKNELMRQLFSKDMDVRRLLQGLELESGTRIKPHETLVIFDEIQENPNALNSLKYFYEQVPEYHIIAAGSLLGVALTHHGQSFPVGKVEFMNIYPMTFYEFLEAIGEDKFCDILKDCDLPLIQTFKNKYEDFLRQYFFVGGMPEVVDFYAKERNLLEIRNIQKNLLLAYEDDFSKHISKSDEAKLRLIWNSLASQIAKENKKFAYGQIKQGARAAEFENALIWLEKTGLVYPVTKITKPDLPLAGYEDKSSFKLYMLDVGLLGAKSLLPAKTLLEGSRIFEEFKGALTEQYVLQQLKAKDSLPIYYWTGRESEVDFVLQDEDLVIPIEVKAEINLKAKSLGVYQNKFHPVKSVRTSLADFKVNNNLYDIPLYLIESMDELL